MEDATVREGKKKKKQQQHQKPKASSEPEVKQKQKQEKSAVSRPLDNSAQPAASKKQQKSKSKPKARSELNQVQPNPQENTPDAQSVETKKKRPNHKKLQQKARLARNLHREQATSEEPAAAQSPPSSTGEPRHRIEAMNLASDSGEEFGEQHQSVPMDSSEALTMNTVEVERLIAELSSTSEAELDSSDSDFNEDQKESGTKRYFLENSGPTCFNCGGTGHIVRDCPETSAVPCSLCAQVGHSRFACPQELCYNCMRPGHHSRECPVNRRRRPASFDTECNRCGQPGHVSRDCSLSWRGYVFSRDPSRDRAAFQEDLRGLRKRCYNCASISHFGDDCPNRRKPAYSTFHLPDYEYLRAMMIRVSKSHEARDRTREAVQAPRHETHKAHKPSFATEAHRRVFTEARGLDGHGHGHGSASASFGTGTGNYSSGSQTKRAKANVPFARYEGNRIVQAPKKPREEYNDFDDSDGHTGRSDQYEEADLRKGSSSAKHRPLYRGGYRR